ncbi:ABC transporter permease [Wenjunlia tyrosinilytica]|uniref:ABC transporter permease n=1 Tax=Wenjunlia tyrosinilytica TaxID=1544741 RepID=A0A917ZUC2_9ACTN|nr:ABC transporter permease [Wenjunlia tyrosinilytica]GGO94511.1 ABC transporter permease [Wenjunlia tyrosinilytica]
MRTRAHQNARAAVTPPAILDRLRAADPRRYVVYAGFALIMVVFSITLRDSGFLTTPNLVHIVQQTAPITVMAVGLVLVLTAGEIDLSIGSVVALSALVAGVMLRDYDSMPLAVAASLAVGAGVGLFNGLFVTRVRVPSFLVTLATLGLVAGLARVMTNLQSVPITHEYFNGLFGSGSMAGISTLVLWSAAAVAVGHYVYRHTRFGAHVLAVGDNARAARVSGVKVERVKVAVLVISGLCAALAGLLYAGRLHGATYTLGETDMLTVIAAVIVGGNRLFGGSGTVVGALVGSLVMGVLNNGLILGGLSVSQQMIARGVIILVAVALTLREEKA